MNESGEMYLKTIYILKQKLKNIRAVDVAREMKYSKASVSKGISNLKNNSLIVLDENNYIEFTKKGLKEAVKIYERFMNLVNYLICELGVCKRLAQREACKLEHVISGEVYKRIMRKEEKNVRVEERIF